MIKFIGHSEELKKYSGVYPNLTVLNKRLLKEEKFQLKDYYANLTREDSITGEIYITGHKSAEYPLYGINYDRRFTIYLDYMPPERDSMQRREEKERLQKIRLQELKRQDKIKYANCSHDNNEKLLNKKWEQERKICDKILKQGYIWIKLQLGSDRQLTWCKQKNPNISFYHNRYYVQSGHPACIQCRVTSEGTSFLIDEPKDKKVK